MRDTTEVVGLTIEARYIQPGDVLLTFSKTVRNTRWEKRVNGELAVTIWPTVGKAFELRGDLPVAVERRSRRGREATA